MFRAAALCLICACAPTFDRARAMIAGQAPLAPADVIIVHGCPARPDGTPSTCNRRRAQAAVEAYEAGLAEHVLFTGGPTLNQYAESRVMAVYAMSRGLPEAAVVIEDRSRHTITNLAVAKRIMKQRGWGTAILVSEAMHLVWAKQLSRTQRIRATLYPSDMLPPYTDAYLKHGEFDELEPWRTQTGLYGKPRAADTDSSAAQGRRVACIIVGPNTRTARATGDVMAHEPGYEVQIFSWGRLRSKGRQAKELARWIESWAGGWNGAVSEIRLVATDGGEAVATLAASAFAERRVPVTVETR